MLDEMIENLINGSSHAHAFALRARKAWNDGDKEELLTHLKMIEDDITRLRESISQAIIEAPK